MCKPKKLGELVFRDLQLVNLALLDKWRWRLLSGASNIWRDILVVRYGVTHMISILDGRVGRRRFASSWLIGVSLLVSKVTDSTYWFRDDLSLRVGFTSFWEDIWVGDFTMCYRFPLLFLISD